ncbi:carbohydrate kinase family protein [Clostridium magnum]|uniref:5-dehydro-2-deoxygluconokinase n=1 Tax=Clostridium magnum DSM 2767 TaxID=1121326 RepID=A0A161YLS1_9CLOT|nr:carbohydrate kinase [Clostridium magnum]KZL91562.1 5-dehydro-2-deoxygluconokinase [Clostridium magnum DSM 2767]SHH47707.1 fructokinase [Clostridium magnum DSM 2767]
MSNNILCVGELLIDFICSDVNSSLTEGTNFIKKAGGAPANVTAAISKLGGHASFAGKVGNDHFGVFLKNTLDSVGVDTSMLVLDNNSNTTLAFVSLKSDGERDFIFNRGADELLTYKELDKEKVYSSKIIHFGSATALLGGPSKVTYLEVMEKTKEKGTFISFDPNYRVDLWKNRLEEFVSISKKCLKYADFVKVSDEEIKIISGKESLEEGIKIFHKLGAKVIAVTLGKDGTLISNGTNIDTIGSIKIKSIDSTGAGDAFVGAVLYKIAQQEEAKNILGDFQKLKEIVAFGNKVGAIVCTKLGAIAALPTLDEVEKC